MAATFDPAAVELHRRGVAMPFDAPGRKGTGTALFVQPEEGRPLRSCSCSLSRHRTCEHVREVAKLARALGRRLGGQSWEESVATSLWLRLAKLLFEARPEPWSEVEVALGAESSGIRVSLRDGELVRYREGSAARWRLLERLGRVGEGEARLDRAMLLDRLVRMQETPEERHFEALGVKTRRQAWEGSFWYRLAYHCLREPALEGGRFASAIDESSGDFTVSYGRKDAPAAVEVIVPRLQVRSVLRLLAEYPDLSGVPIHPIPLRSIFRVTAETELDLEVRPAILALQEGGEGRFYDPQELEKFRYGDLVYLQELGILAELERRGAERKFRPPRSMKLRRSQIPSYLAAHREALADGELVLDGVLGELKVLKEYDRIEVSTEAAGRSWYWLSIRYRFGAHSVSLADILRSKAEGAPFLEIGDGWIDLGAPFVEEVEGLAGRAGGAGEPEGHFRLTASELLRLQMTATTPLEIQGEEARAAILRRILELRPAVPYAAHGSIPGLTSALRSYQESGVDWLRFLYENRLGGLLCDDMGLGKTHQAMALMLSLRRVEAVEGPFLVVCPTSVLPHWCQKIRDHAPGLQALAYHGPRRQRTSLAEADVVVTTYGVLRQDHEALAELVFALVVFDEIQHVKSRDTLAYAAASRLQAEVKLGLTGTPIENSVAELKSLLDLVLPGYLGKDEDFKARFGRLGEEAVLRTELEPLRRLVSPFILRRLKSAVLDELPEKIEDLRTCALSEDQAELYRGAIAGRGKELLETLRRRDEPLPYIHVFALLNLLKQICDHPALALRQLDRAGDYRSGKWDLYCDLLEEALDGGAKVVVFTQYLGMIELMRRHLLGLGVDSVSLTGASTRRGELIERFNRDPGCRVFLGSLKAGGTGIDLQAGSVVVHYDRWWNAAREDQATDRVHRLGQRRAVQVFKLITEGTLEEKISAIIERKRELMQSIVQADHPSLSKVFTRDELVDLLQPAS